MQENKAFVSYNDRLNVIAFKETREIVFKGQKTGRMLKFDLEEELMFEAKKNCLWKVE